MTGSIQQQKLSVGPHKVVMTGNDEYDLAWGRGPEKIEEFGTFEDARESLDQYWNFIIHFRRSAIGHDKVEWKPEAQDTRKAYYRDKLKEWMMALERLIERKRRSLRQRDRKLLTC